jgi:maltose O-acetyltransferase
MWLSEVLFDLLANTVLGLSVAPRPVRWRGLRALGMDVAACVVGPEVYFGTARIAIGAGAQIGREAYFDGPGSITVGARAGVGPRSMIITGSHDLGGSRERVGPLAPRPIVLGEGSWLGAGVTVLPGVTVGAGCVVGAGSVVVRDCAPNGLYAGVPAVRVRDLDTAAGVPAVRVRDLDTAPEPDDAPAAPDSAPADAPEAGRAWAP